MQRPEEQHTDKLVRSKRAWAIRQDKPDIDGSRRPCLLGYGAVDHQHAVPVHTAGYNVATFPTREIARDWLKAAQQRENGRMDGWSYYRDCRVVRVAIAVEEV